MPSRAKLCVGGIHLIGSAPLPNHYPPLSRHRSLCRSLRPNFLAQFTAQGHRRPAPAAAMIPASRSLEPDHGAVPARWRPRQSPVRLVMTTKMSPISGCPALAAWIPSPMPGSKQRARPRCRRRRPRPPTARRRPSPAGSPDRRCRRSPDACLGGLDPIHSCRVPAARHRTDVNVGSRPTVSRHDHGRRAGHHRRDGGVLDPPART